MAAQKWDMGKAEHADKNKRMDMHMKNGLIISAKKVIYGCALVFLLFLAITSFLYSSDGYTLEVNGIRRIAQDIVGCTIGGGYSGY
ncbi:MAG: hypothetical protein NC331_00875 [Lachnospiraceae bacterium]|nr:hypothetical protein [Lachnospiraceae bacterium]